MPELPEVETTRRGIRPHILHQPLEHVEVSAARLRYPADAASLSKLIGQPVQDVSRRAKYLLIHFPEHIMVVHLGMSGSLRVLADDAPKRKHDHVILSFASTRLAYHDPRRFGGFVVMPIKQVDSHPLLAHLGPEPLSDALTAEYLYHLSRGRSQSVKAFIMDQRVVVGVGNIYATEALFESGIRPDRAAGRISLARYHRLTHAIRRILAAAIEQGGTTLRDFVSGTGQPGYFAQTLQVYGRADKPCPRCSRPLSSLRLTGRASVFCRYCQR